jgi:hypothetical protein
MLYVSAIYAVQFPLRIKLHSVNKLCRRLKQIETTSLLEPESIPCGKVQRVRKVAVHLQKVFLNLKNHSE